MNLKEYKPIVALIWFLLNCCFLFLMNFKLAYYIYCDIGPEGVSEVVTTILIVEIPLLTLTLTISFLLVRKFVLWIDRWVNG